VDNIEEVARLGKNSDIAGNAPRGLDFSSAAGRIPGAVWKNLDQLKGYLRRQGAVLWDGKSAEALLDAMGKVDGTYKNAAFMVRPNGTYGVVIRSNATRREILHEIGHLLTFRHLGADDYAKLGDDVKEHLASLFVLSRRGPIDRLTLQEVALESGALLEGLNLDQSLLDLLKKWGINP
jgi:hypothetical protein